MKHIGVGIDLSKLYILVGSNSFALDINVYGKRIKIRCPRKAGLNRNTPSRG